MLQHDPVTLPPPQIPRVHDLADDGARVVEATHLHVRLGDEFVFGPQLLGLTAGRAGRRLGVVVVRETAGVAGDAGPVRHAALTAAGQHRGHCE